MFGPWHLTASEPDVYLEVLQTESKTNKEIAPNSASYCRQRESEIYVIYIIYLIARIKAASKGSWVQTWHS